MPLFPLVVVSFLRLWNLFLLFFSLALESLVFTALLHLFAVFRGLLFPWPTKLHQFSAFHSTFSSKWFDPILFYTSNFLVLLAVFWQPSSSWFASLFQSYFQFVSLFLSTFLVLQPGCGCVVSTHFHGSICPEFYLTLHFFFPMSWSFYRALLWYFSFLWACFRE